MIYEIHDKEGHPITGGDTEEDALYNYQQWATDRAAEDGEYYAWQEQVYVIGFEDGEEVYRCERCAIMDSRLGAGNNYSDVEYAR